MAFWKPGTVAPGSTIDREAEKDGEVAHTSAQQNGHLGLSGQRQRLPIYKQRATLTAQREGSPLMRRAGSRLLYLIERFPVVIVVGQTGCGKTTRALNSASL